MINNSINQKFNASPRFSNSVTNSDSLLSKYSILAFNSCLSFIQLIYLIRSFPNNIDAINICEIIIINCLLASFDIILPLPYVDKDVYDWYFYAKAIIVIYFIFVLIYNCIAKQLKD